MKKLTKPQIVKAINNSRAFQCEWDEIGRCLEITSTVAISHKFSGLDMPWICEILYGHSWRIISNSKGKPCILVDF